MSQHWVCLGDLFSSVKQSIYYLDQSKSLLESNPCLGQIYVSLILPTYHKSVHFLKTRDTQVSVPHLTTVLTKFTLHKEAANKQINTYINYISALSSMSKIKQANETEDNCGQGTTLGPRTGKACLKWACLKLN